jgi:hypothetical protein
MQNKTIVNVHLSTLSYCIIDYDNDVIDVYLTLNTNKKSKIITNVLNLTNGIDCKFVFNSIPSNLQLLLNNNLTVDNFTLYNFGSIISNVVTVVKQIASTESLNVSKDNIKDIAKLIGDITLTKEEIDEFAIMY